MRRRIRLIVLFGLIGFVVTTALAWGAAALRPLNDDDFVHAWPVAHEQGDLWLELQQTAILQSLTSRAETGGGFPGPGTWVRTGEGPEWAPSWSAWERFEVSEKSHWWVEELVAGWPWPAFRGERWEDFQHIDDAAPRPGGTRSLWTIPALNDADIPLRPMLPGLLVNSTLYGVILWLLWFAPGAIKRTLRGRRGACVRCGYDLRGGGLAACPECGNPTKPPATM